MPNDHTDHTWKMSMQTLMKRMKKIKISEQIDEAIWKWYFENGKEVPDWKSQKDPQWWIDYLKSLDTEQ